MRLAAARMTASVKEISIMRGLDPRDLTLVAYGGAGPLHAAAIAKELGINKIVIPPMPGEFSAFGLLAADTRYDVAHTRLTPLNDISLEDLQGLLQPLREEMRRRLYQDGFQEKNIRFMVAGAIGPTRDVLQQSSLAELIQEKNMFAKTADAVNYFKGKVVLTDEQKKIASQTNL